MQTNQKKRSSKEDFMWTSVILGLEVFFFLFAYWMYQSTEKGLKELSIDIVEPLDRFTADSIIHLDNMANNTFLLCFFLGALIFATLCAFLYFGIKYLYYKKRRR